MAPYYLKGISKDAESSNYGAERKERRPQMRKAAHRRAAKTSGNKKARAALKRLDSLD